MPFYRDHSFWVLVGVTLMLAIMGFCEWRLQKRAADPTTENPK